MNQNTQTHEVEWWEEEFARFNFDPIIHNKGRMYFNANQVRGFIHQLLSSHHTQIVGRLREKIEGMKIRNNKKKYDGDDLLEPGRVYGIAAESWTEIIRYEDGHDAAIYDILTALEKEVCK